MVETADGEVILKPTAGAEFFGSSLPAGWIPVDELPVAVCFVTCGGDDADDLARQKRWRATIFVHRFKPAGRRPDWGANGP